MKTKFELKYYKYLDELRDLGETNMFGATPYLMEEFSIEKDEAKKILSDWMKTYHERHK